MKAWIRHLWLLAAVPVVGAGCFSTPDLPKCGEGVPCDETLPVCEDGLCFHHTFRYVVPPCSARADGPCCDLAGGRLDQDPDCLLRDEPFPGNHLSAPVLGEDGRFYFTRVSQDSRLFLVVRSSTQGPGSSDLEVDLDLEVPEEELGAPDGALRRAPAVASDGTALVAAAGSLVARDAAGGAWSVWESGRKDAGGTLSGPAAFCDSGVVAWTTTDSVRLAVPGKEVVGLALDIGIPLAGVGVLYHTASGRLLVPVDGGSRLLCLAVDGATGKLEAAWSLNESDLSGVVQGMALDDKGYVYALAGTRLLAVSVLNGPDGNNWWTVEWDEGMPAAGPVIRSSGEALLSLVKGGVYAAEEQAPKDLEQRMAGIKFEQFVPLRLGGFAGLVGGQETLSFVVDAGASLLEAGKDGDFRQIHWKGECDEPSMSLPSPEGAVAVTCGSSFKVLAAPEHPDPEFEWPAARGWGNRGCR